MITCGKICINLLYNRLTSGGVKWEVICLSAQIWYKFLVYNIKKYYR